MDYPLIIADRYNELLLLSESERDTLSFIDKAIYEIVSVRCEIDMGGYESPFVQYFTNESHLEKFISILSTLKEEYLTSEFENIRSILSKDDFWERRVLDDSKNKVALDNILCDLDQKQLLWLIDEKLGELLVNTK